MIYLTYSLVDVGYIAFLILLINYYSYIHKSMSAVVQAKHFISDMHHKKELSSNKSVQNIH